MHPGRERTPVGQDLVGRVVELERISGLLHGVGAEGRAQLFVGPAGVGKSRLLAEAAEMALAAGMRVISATGSEFEASVSYAGLDRLLAPLREEMELIDTSFRQALLVALGRAEGHPPPPLLIRNAALAVLEVAARREPSLVLLDDFLWLDESTIDTLAFIVQRVQHTSLRVLGATREVAALPRRGWTLSSELRVQPLSSDEAALLLDQAHPELSRMARHLVLEHASGNPLAILELGNAAQRIRRSRADVVGQVPLSDRLRRSFLARASDLTDRTREALLLLALDGREDLRDLDKLGIDFNDLVEAERAGLVVVDQVRLRIRFSHPLVRDAVVEDADSATKRRAHLTIADALSDEPIRRAWHMADAVVGVDQDTADMLERSAQACLARGDVYGATRALSRSAQLSPSLIDRRRRLAQAAYFEAEVIGEPDDAAEHLDDLRTISFGAVQSLHAVVATAVIYADVGGDCGSAHHMLERAVLSGLYGWSADSDELIEAFFAWFIICWQAGVAEYWDTYFDALRRLTPQCPPMLSLLSRAFADPIRLGVGVRDELKSAIRAHIDDPDPMTIIRMTTAGVYVDLLGEGRPAIWRLIEEGRHGEGFRTYFRALMTQCLDDFASARWSRGRELADEGEAAAKDTALTASWYFVYAEALLSAARGDAADAIRWTEELEQSTQSRGAYGINCFGHHVRVLVARSQEDWEGMYVHAAALGEPGTFPRYAPHALWVLFDLVDAAVRTGRTEQARAHVNAAKLLDVAAVSPRIALLVGGASGLIDDGPAGLRAFESALEDADSSEWPFDYARVQLAYGMRLRREARLRDARVVLRAALAAFETIGALPWAASARTELRAARGRLDTPSEALLPLTPQELSIAELAAAGLSNKDIGSRLFLSPRTVGGHLYRIFPKLGITNRAALRDALAKAASPEPSDSEQLTKDP